MYMYRNEHRVIQCCTTLASKYLTVKYIKLYYLESVKLVNTVSHPGLLKTAVRLF